MSGVQRKVRVLFVGTLPPPVHGFSLMTERMLSELQQAGCLPEVFRLGPGVGLLQLVGGYLRFLAKLLRPGPVSLYVGLSSGLRQWVELLYILPATARKAKVFAHHHTFLYLKARHRATSLLARIPLVRHVVLCQCMEQGLIERYGRLAGPVHVLSNAALLDVPASQNFREWKPRDVLRVGFLANITSEKGVFEYFAILDQVLESGQPVEGVVAGPVDPTVAERFAQALACRPHVSHLGPVYGDDKWQFLRSLDAMLFPTMYANEAEPVVAHEALACGVPVLAYERGCLAEMMAPDRGLVVHEGEKGRSQLAQQLVEWSRGPQHLWRAKCRARERHLGHVREARASLEKLTAEMGGGQ